MDIQPNLTPFWHDVTEPEEGEEPVQFRLAPLTQPQVNELFKTFERTQDSAGNVIDTPTEQTWYKAGCMGLDGGREIRNLTIAGKPAQWPKDRNVIPFKLVSNAGVKLCMDAWGQQPESTEKN